MLPLASAAPGISGRGDGKAGGLFELRSPAIHDDEEKRYRAFIGYDPEGYYLEFDAFLEHPRNEALSKALVLLR